VSAPRFQLVTEDAVVWLSGLPDESIDLVVTDPPYESLEKHRKVGTTTRLKQSAASSNEWFSIFPNMRFPALFRQLYRVLKNDRHLYLFCDQETAFVVKPMGEAEGFKFWKPIVWDKVHIGMGYHYRCRYEFVLFFEKGKRKLNDLGMPDVLTVPRVMSPRWPTEKPVDLLEKLVGQSSEAGQLVVDPFMGSGSAALAAAKLGCNFAGCDFNPGALDVTRARIRDGADEVANMWGT
jgi:site-specific DNA-methyltransferase (adenine-specific)